ncbi:MAG: DNA repair protein [Catenulispora sp. 13_1_20CM_3_70_7]|nr:MAG: DNA repair protein [Catenulispora sp. 13_1_20CM_3_70_7]
MGEAPEAWGRVAEDGTVYVRTADGERQVGSWAAGSPDEALAYYQRKFDGLKVEVDLLANRLKQTGPAAPSPKDTLDKIGKLRESIAGAAAVGDLDGLLARLDGLVELAEQRRAEHKAAREQQQAEARTAKQALAEEAERLAASTEWRVAGDRMKALLEEWKAAPRLDRKTDDELWHRLSQSRSAFAKRRKQHFAELDAQRGEIRAHKEQLIAEAESLQDSTDWNTTAGRFRDLMSEWKTAGRAQRDVEDELWKRFKAAQDTFFAARNAVLDERSGAERENLAAKEVLVAEAEALLPITDHRAARTALRSINERWEAIGPVPRDARGRIEGRLHTVDRAIADAEAAELSRKDPEKRARAEATVEQLRTAIEKLRGQAEKARTAGQEKKAADAEASIAARQEWLAEAEKALEEFTR